MLQAQKMNIEMMKQFNIISVLRVIRERGPISRSEIAECIDLSRPSVSEIVSDLIVGGWIRELTASPGGRGRRPIPLEINPNGRYVLGAEIGAYQLSVILCNLNSEVIGQSTVPLTEGVTPELALTEVCSMCESLIASCRVERSLLVGIGVAMHGVVHPGTGYSVYAPNLGWHDVPVKDFLEAKMGLPTYVDSDTNTSALAELWTGVATGSRQFITMVVDYGIGAGIIFDGKLYRGIAHIEGQIGHTTVDEDGPRCACGNFGCLEVMASEPAIVRRVLKRLRAGERSVLSSQFDHWDENSISIQTIYQAARSGDELCKDVLRSAGRYLGIGMSTLINLFNPLFVVLSGGMVEVADLILPDIEDVIVHRALGDAGKSTKVLVSKFGKLIYPLGGATLVLEHVFQSPEAVAIPKSIQD